MRCSVLDGAWWLKMLDHIWLRMHARPLLFLMLACAGMTLLWFAYPHEFNMHDPWAYSQTAHRIAVDWGPLSEDVTNHPFSHRLAVTVPVAILYHYFGVNLYTTHVWPLCAALLILVAVFAALPTNSAKITGVILCSTSITLFNQTVTLHPDVICTAFLAASMVLLFYRAESSMQGPWTRAAASFGASLSLFIAFLAKISAYWVLPLWAYALIADIRQKQWHVVRRFHLPALGILVVFGIFYLWLCDHVWGHPLARLVSIEEMTGKHLWAWHNATIAEWIARLTVLPAGLLLRDYGAWLVCAALAPWFIPVRYRFWVYYCLSITLIYWFGSTSFSRYEPLLLSTRMVLPILPGVFVLAALFVDRMTMAGDLSGQFRTIAARLVMISVAVIPFLIFMHNWIHASSPEKEAMQIIARSVEARQDRQFGLVCADLRTPESLAFYFSYAYPANLDVMHASNFDAQKAAELDEVFVLVHEGTVAFMKNAYGHDTFHERALLHINAPLLYRHRGVWLFHSTMPTAVQEEMIESYKVISFETSPP